MANIPSLQRRIKTAQNVSKTTRAMQMISTSKLKRAQDAAVQSRPYVERLTSLSSSLVSKVSKKQAHEYMRVNNEEFENSLVIVISPDKGLAGGLVSNLAREILRFYLENKNAFFVTVGKKAEFITARITQNIVASFPFSTSLPSFDMVYPIAKIVDEYFLTQKVTSVKCVTTKFVNLFTQTPIVNIILPVSYAKETPETNTKAFMLFEPSIEKILPTLLKQYLEIAIYQNLLETYASEQAARTIAMKNATDNALEIIDELKLEYNKSRQEKITEEILDISGTSTTVI